MEDLHPKFLEALREVYPLAVLGSLSMTVAAFTTQTYPNAQVYAITAASLFLIAFVASFAFRIIDTYFLAVLSYASTGIAILFLFFVVWEFAKANSILSNSLKLVGNVPYIFVFLVSILFLYGFRRRTKSRIVRWCCLFVIPLLVLYVFYYLVLSLSYFVTLDISVFGYAISFIIGPILFGLEIIISVIVMKQRKKKHETIP